MQETLFQPSRKVRGKSVKARLWSVRLKLPGDLKPKDYRLHTADEKAARQKAAQLRAQIEQERAGVIAPAAQRLAAQTPLTEHINEFLRRKEALGRDAKYLKNMRYNLELLASECSWNFVRDVSADTFETWRTKQTLSPKRLNDFLDDINALLNWMCKTDRFDGKPLRGVEKVDTSTYESKKRRAITPAQLAKLLQVTGKSSVVYLFAAYTGLRRKELGLLQWRDLQLEGDKPALHLRAGSTKNRKGGSIPLHPRVVQALREYRPLDALPQGSVFRGRVPRMNTHRKYLAAAGIPYLDEAGRVFDFHSLRVTFATMLASHGIGTRQAMELMRHTEERLTTQIYQDAGHLQLREALGKLPSSNEHYTLGSTLETPQIAPKMASAQCWEDLAYLDPNEWELEPPEGFTYAEAQAVLGTKLVRAVGFEPTAPAV